MATRIDRRFLATSDLLAVNLGSLQRWLSLCVSDITDAMHAVLYSVACCDLLDSGQGDSLADAFCVANQTAWNALPLYITRE